MWDAYESTNLEAKVLGVQGTDGPEIVLAREYKSNQRSSEHLSY